MKKRILILLVLMFCIGINTLSAKTANDVACDYHIKNINGDLMTDAQVQIIGYNDGAGGKVLVFFKDTSGKYVQYSSPTYDWQNYGNTDSYSSAMLRFFTTDKKGTTFIANYKKNSRCPVIYANVSSDGSTIDVENHVLDQTLIEATSESLSSFYERLRTTGGEWTSREDFYKDDSGQTTVKDDLVCSYNMEFDMYNITTPVEFRTMYNASTGAKTYRITVNGSGRDVTLDEDVALSLGQGGSHLIQIKSDQLKKIFIDGKCLERNKVYHYHSLATDSYIITTDEQEAKDNGTAGRYEDGDAPDPSKPTNPGVNLEKPDLDIVGGGTDCKTLLGPGLTKVLKFAINTIRIIGVIVSIVMGMITLLPAVNKGDAGELQKAARKCIWIAVVLIIVVMLPTLIRVIGKLFGFDTTCI